MVHSRPTGRKDSDIIAGIDFLSVFMRNAEERYYPIQKSQQPYDIYDNFFDYDFTTRRSRFLINTKYTTTEATTPSTTTRKPKLSVPTLPTIRKIETLTSEAPSNIELRTAPPPITKHEVYRYIKRKSGKENEAPNIDKGNLLQENNNNFPRIIEVFNEDLSRSTTSKPDTTQRINAESKNVAETSPTNVESIVIEEITKKPEVSVRMESRIEAQGTTEKSDAKPKTTGEQLSQPLRAEKDLLVDPLKSKTQLGSKEERGNSVTQEVSKNPPGDIEYKKEDSFTEVSVQVNADNGEAFSIIEPSAINLNSQKSDLFIDEEEPLTIEATELSEKIVESPLFLEDPTAQDGSYNLESGSHEQKRVNRNDDTSYDYDYSSRMSQNKARSISYSAVIQIPGEWKKKNGSESVAESNDYYVTSKYAPRTENLNLGQKEWEKQVYHTTERNWGTTEKNWGTPTPWIQKENISPDVHWSERSYQTTEKNWGTTEKNWGVPSKPKIWGVQQTTPKVWGVQQTTPKVWGVQQTTPKIWGVQQTTPKVWGVQQTTPKVWGTTEKNWGHQQGSYNDPQPKWRENYRFGQAEQNYEINEKDSIATNGRAHGVQEEKPLQIQNSEASTNPSDNQKVGYVVEGRNYKKYRVEERTSDGFIVGEYGVLSNNDGSLRGVRYTADGAINPSLIYDALMKFLAL